jgi:subtilisin family serine protease
MLRRFYLVCIAFGCVWATLPVAAGDAPSLRFKFREPQLTTYRVETPLATGRGGPSLSAQARTNVTRLKAWPEAGSTNHVEFGNRIVLKLKQADDPKALLVNKSLRVSRVLTDRTFILEGADTLTALREAEALAQDSTVAACYPVMRRRAKLHASYARRPNDPYLFRPELPNSEWQWHLENRDTNGVPLGVDLNVRAAWNLSRGAGVVLAIADDGFEMEHPDLAPQVADAPHFNFHSQDINVGPSGFRANHATAVAGLVAAKDNNEVGISGVAPAATLANWVLFNSNDDLPDEEQVMDMFQFKSNIVSVQNHSWGKIPEDPQQLRSSLIEQIGISNAVTFGRGGRGVIMVRSGGNGRSYASNVADDEYPSDPRVIAVAAARADGRVARYSSPGACILVAAPSGDDSEENNPCITNSPNLFTTDRQGSAGYNRVTSPDDLGDYGFGESGFSGTSAAAPQISGVVALILGANPNLTYRDVQQVLLLSAHHFDTSDPDLRQNGAGLLVSHNLGFGVPDAGVAVSLAKIWPNRPPLLTITRSDATVRSIPDLGLRLVVEGTDVPESLLAIPALPGSGVHPDLGTEAFPLADIGAAEEPISEDLKGRAAFIQRDGRILFCEKLQAAAQAGAPLAIVYNHIDQTERIVMGGTDFIPIPAVMISQLDGEALRDFVSAHPDARVRLDYEPVRYSFDVSETLLCEHVGVRVDTDHTRRGDLRMTLVSPMGTRSVLQAINTDDSPGPTDWTYYSTQHFFETSAGAWTVEIGDEDDGGSGHVKSVSLIIRGVPITDRDRDGLHDDWEMRSFQSLDRTPRDDPDRDGFNNAREQVMLTDPANANTPFRIDLSVWDNRLVRLSWPANAGSSYQVRLGMDSTTPLTTVTNIPGRFPETEWFVPYTDVLNQFFRVQALPIQQ